ncbi:UbiX family flavin prenyltransferase [Nitratifractor sp.]|uniref:UbiX family flavin prenyltransferase n=1 Tax=Nitratifractor sp. TaxID=2268144 RepID=UPI0025FF9107|nr:UbiX family flavin prenyltransferase [Nitratifractor sp.]
MKLAVAISGASGVRLGEQFLRYLPETVEVHLVISDNARTVDRFERANLTLHSDADIAASVASGSFGVDATAVIPCSMNTLAKIACGISDTLTTRIAAVALKERKPLLLAPREMPFSVIALENMLKLSRLGVVIAPPVAGYYSDCDDLDAMERFLVGKWYDALGIENTLYRRWGE